MLGSVALAARQGNAGCSSQQPTAASSQQQTAADDETNDKLTKSEQFAQQQPPLYSTDGEDGERIACSRVKVAEGRGEQQSDRCLHSGSRRRATASRQTDARPIASTRRDDQWEAIRVHPASHFCPSLSCAYLTTRLQSTARK
jgi:hypothetical protein